MVYFSTFSFVSILLFISSQYFPTVLLQLLEIVIPAYLHGAVQDKEREVVMAILESLNNVIKDVKEACVRGPEQLGKICDVIKAVLQSKVCDCNSSI